MELSDVIKNIKDKGRMLVLGTVLSACGEPDVVNNFNYGSGSQNETEYCSQACGRVYACDPKKNGTEQECINVCTTENYPDSWKECVLQEPCDAYLVGTCDDFLD
ncbi:hypothetical protein HYV87_00325 [Candidatus Woesearchaeota archaeon]|nr:hypothetical protein [Candidatus Woesearchaeota archaeon]MBI2581558.1 hypothetical protein [Candidatus Woesearchaeota archaeon]